LSKKVLHTSYLNKSDKQRREESNRNFSRIAAALPTAALQRNGYSELSVNQIETRLAAAVAGKDWPLVARLSAELLSHPPSVG
jgi:hypothetical protein